MRLLRGQGASRVVLLIAIRVRRLRARRRRFRVLMPLIRLCIIKLFGYGWRLGWGVHGFMDGIPLERYK